MKVHPNLLIVDDNEANLSLLSAIISKIDVTIIKAFSGFEALEKIQGVELALAIIDVNMPEMDGYELALKLNEERSDYKVPVIFLTANFVNDLDLFKGYGSGAVDYIFKPVNRQVLISKINVFLDLFNQKQTIILDALQLEKTAEELLWANSALKKSEEKYRSYLENAPDGVFVTDANGKYIEVNEAASRMTGYSKEELLQMSIADLTSEESFFENLAHFRKINSNSIYKKDMPFRHKNGTKRWWTIQTVKHDETRYLGFTKDITDKKKVEDELKNSLEQLHQLTKHLEKVREDERIAISRELHDYLGQALTAVKIDLGLIRQKVTDKEVESKIIKVTGLVSEAIKTTQRLTSQLRPEIIEDLGIEAAIDWYTKEFSQRNGIEIFLDMEPEISISPDASLTIFRIMQESLTNVARHSKATKVYISLSKSSESLVFKISDNGIGITDCQIKARKSFGIISMKERSASLGGTFSISGGNGSGTVIKLNFPINHN